MKLDEKIRWNFSPYLTVFEPKYTFDVIMKCVKSCMHITELVQDEHLWLKSMYKKK